MSFLQKLLAGTPTLSFELFPPKNPTGWATLYGTLGDIAKLAPDFISVTYGAGGSTRSKTIDLVARIQDELGIESMAHLTCVGHSQGELKEILGKLVETGIHNVLALRGDPPKGDKSFKPHPDGFRHATELIGFIRGQFPLQMGCAFYPEKHLEAESLEKDLQFLKQKQELGAQFAVSQLFFDNEIFYRFRDKAAAMGIFLPLVAGIMPVVDANQLTRFKELSGCAIPEKLTALLKEGRPEEAIHRGVEFATRQCDDLLRNGIAGIHIYSLNRSGSSARITDNLRKLNHFPLAPAASGSVPANP